jgi:predicted transglutaminase-like cysteine proteinase
MNWRTYCAAVALSVSAATSAGAADMNRVVLPMTGGTSGPDILGTIAKPIQGQRFGESLTRAREDATHSPAMQRMIGAARTLSPMQQMMFVQRVVSSNIHWISDATEWGQHDYWASAAQTLSRGAGDGEDRAIVKFQALRALGFNNSDLFLTMARDRVGGAETVLTVRKNGHFYVFDDDGSAPFLAEQRRYEFEPVISFGLYGAWVHARPKTIAVAARTPTALARP